MSFIVPILARMSFHSTVRSRRMVVALLVTAIPLLLGGALLFGDAQNAAERAAGGRYASPFSANFLEPLSYLVLGGTVPFTAILMAGAVVADDVEDRTFSYILVRPVKRHQIFLSRLLPAAAASAALAIVQAFGFGVLRLLSWSLYGQGTVETYRLADGTVASIGSGALLSAQVPLSLLAVALAALAFTALFAFVSVLTTRYHFLANLLVFGSVEFIFGNLGGQGAGVLTATFHARSLTMAVAGVASYHPVPWWVAIPALVAYTALWTWLGARQMGTRDFNVTSAAS